MTTLGVGSLTTVMKSTLKTKVTHIINALASRSSQFTFFAEQLRLGKARVRQVIGTEVSISDKEIEDSLWHYYYDVDKTVNYLISTVLFLPIGDLASY